MSFRRNNDVDDAPRLGRYSLLRKNFVQELMLATIFLLCFTASFLAGWDLWVVPSNYQSGSILFSIGISILFGIVVTVPIGFILKFTQKNIRERKRQKEQEKNEKDFLDQ